MDCDRVLPLDVVEAQQAKVRAAINEIAAATGATTIDLRPPLCDDQGCPSRRENVVLYSDSNHISVAGSETLIDDFTKVLSTLD
jgi:hypothetical protein